MNAPVDYIAEITQVREVVLRGTADLAYWAEHLRSVNLFPAESGGQAQVVISTIASKYLGIRFRELCIAVLVRRQDPGAGPDGLYLAQAYNSSRLFAFIERRCFATPYRHGKIDVEASLPATMRLIVKGETLVTAEMAAGTAPTRAPVRSGDECWEGPIYLPGASGATVPGRWFRARLAGHLQAYPFLPADVLTLRPAPDHPILRCLVDSRFTGTEWAVRPDGVHARSRTLDRTPLV
jgi:hypothetical protein